MIEMQNPWDQYVEFFAEYSSQEDLDCKRLVIPRVRGSLGNLEAKTLLDFGCGVGEYSRMFSDLGAVVSAYDLSEKMIQKAISLNRCKKVEYVSDLESLGNQQFDIVYCQMVLVVLDIDTIETVIKIISSRLKTDGKAVFINTNPDSIGLEFKDFYSPEIIDRVIGAPYKTIVRTGNESITVTDYHYTARFLEQLYQKYNMAIIDEEVIQQQHLLQIVEKK